MANVSLRGHFGPARRIVTLPLVLILAAVIQHVNAADLAGPAQSQSRIANDESGEIRGTVYSLDDGKVLGGARLRLVSQGDVNQREARSDEAGRFAFDRLKPGSYLLTAAKAGYQFRRFGQKDGATGQPIELARGQRTGDANIYLPRSRAIAGHITDEFGDPIADVSVQALRVQFTDGVRQLVPMQRTARTDDLGAYRIFGLSSGTYYVTATAPGGTGRGASGPGPMAGIRFPGARAGGGAMFSSEPESISPDAIAYTPAYYPGTPSLADAVLVPVSDGQDSVSVDFPLSLGRSTSISGRAITAAGEPLKRGVASLRPAFDIVLPRTHSAAVTEGEFVLAGVPPGSYVLQVEGGPSATSDTTRESGSLNVTVSGVPLAGVVVGTARGATIRGRVILEDSTAQDSIKGIQVVAVTAGQILGPGIASIVSADATFELRGVHEASLLRLANVPPGWQLKSVSVRNEDVTDQALRVDPNAQTNDVTIRLSKRQARLRVSLSDRDTGDNGDAEVHLVTVFSADESRWGPHSRFVKTTQIGSGNMSEIEGLPEGRYYVATIHPSDRGVATDPEFLNQLKSGAAAVTLREGVTAQVQLPTRRTRR